MKNAKVKDVAETDAAGAATGPHASGYQTESVVHLPLELVIPTPDNPRRIADGDPRVAERAESIRTKGQLMPAIVRPHPTEPGKFDLRAGELRYRALKLLGRPTIMAIVRELTDQQAMEITVIENLQRNDLRPLEEARGVAKLLTTGRDYREVAEQLGKSAAWVCRRAALAQLAPCWEALAEQAPPAKPGRKPLGRGAGCDSGLPADAGVDGDSGREEGDEEFDGEEEDDQEELTEEQRLAAELRKVELSVAHMELLARFPRDVQERLYEKVTQNGGWNLRPGRFGDFERLINDEILGLRKCGFDTDDPTLLRGVVKCTRCIRRASVNPGLFDEDPDGLAKNDQCLDRSCFEKKQAAHLERQWKELQAEYPDLKQVRTAYDSDPNLSKLPQAGKNEWDDNLIVKEGTKGATPALVAVGPGKGELVWVVSQKRGRDGKPVADGPKTLAEKRHGLELRRRMKAVELLKADLPKRLALWQGMSWERRAVILVTFPPSPMIEEPYGKKQYDAYERLETDPAGVVAALWKGVAEQVCKTDLRHFGSPQEFDSTGKTWSLWDEMKAVCGVVGLSWVDYYHQAVEEIAEPKSWAAQETAENVVRQMKGGRKDKPAAEAATGTEPGDVHLETAKVVKDYARRMEEGETINISKVQEEQKCSFDRALALFDAAVDLRKFPAKPGPEFVLPAGGKKRMGKAVATR